MVIYFGICAFDSYTNGCFLQFDCDDIEDMAGNYICVGVTAAVGLGPFGGF